MRLNLYAIYDRCSGVYDRPWCARSDEEAARSFTHIATNAEHPVGMNPDDFTCFRVGTWHETEGTVGAETPEKIINGVEAVSRSREIMPGSLKSNGVDLTAVGGTD